MDAVKITDFGIATLAQEIMDHEIEANDDITKSTSGTVKGAIPFMAPEMMFRKVGQAIDSPADVWSLGAMMFLAMTGEKPFGVGFAAAAAVSKNEREPWPAFMTNDEQFKVLALELQELVERCLKYDPNERPTADEIVAEISLLCNFYSPRHRGKVYNMPNRYFGFLMSDNRQKSMFHRESVYGPNRAQTELQAVYSVSRGNPHPRAYPVLIQKQG